MDGAPSANYPDNQLPVKRFFNAKIAGKLISFDKNME